MTHTLPFNKIISVLLRSRSIRAVAISFQASPTFQFTNLTRLISINLSTFHLLDSWYFTKENFSSCYHFTSHSVFNFCFKFSSWLGFFFHKEFSTATVGLWRQVLTALSAGNSWKCFFFHLALDFFLLFSIE